MSDNENKIEELERAFPSLSGDAFSDAFNSARKSGQRVLVTEMDTIYEILPDGTRRKVKKIEGPYSYELGKKITLR